MQILLPIQLAWNSLFRHKGRTVLTIFGIVIGIALVIIVMSAGQSIKGLILGEFESLGSDYIQVEIKVPSTGRNSTGNAFALASGIEITTFKNNDVEALGKLSNIKSFGSGVMGQNVVSYLGNNKTINYLAVTPEIMPIMGIDIVRGRVYSLEEDKSLAKVVVLGSKVSKDLFGNQDPIGQNVRIGNLKFKVVGITKEQGATFGFDFDNLVYLPLHTTQKLIMGIDYVMFMTAKVEDVSKMNATADEMVRLLRDRHDTSNEQEDDFAVTTAKEAMDMIDAVFNGITLLLVSIAGISLLVGGVGIMNIMYVSVTERTFEIGLRKAIGAKPGQILWQFLWEAIVVTITGGVVGIIVGTVVTFLISFSAGQLGFNWKFNFSWQSIALAVSFCAFVGLIFGYYPAQKAAKLNAIEALRHE